MSTKVDYIVVGQGLAGTLFCWMLEERGRKFVVFDQGHAGSSSKIAAGIINPVTGRRYVKSWMYDKLLPTALACYSNIERRLNLTLLRQRNILRYLPDFKSENDWLSKSAKPGYHPYILNRAETEETSQLDLGGMWGEVTNSYQLDIGTLINSYRRYLREKSLLREQVFDSELLLKCRDTQTIYGLSYERIVFCEGHLLTNNRLFASDFLNPSKGEVLILRIPGYHPKKNLKKKFFLVPWIDDLFWFGAKDGWHFTDPLPSQEGFEILHQHARQLIKSDFEIVDHLAAIRPTIKDRRPVAGRHPDFDNIFIFNGLGTKGASLGPFWAEKLINFIESEGKLEREVNVNRFKSAD